MVRRGENSDRNNNNNDGNNNNNNNNNNNGGGEVEIDVEDLEWRMRNRAVAERVASSLARPSALHTFQMGHASRDKSAVSSCPTGYRYAKFCSSSANNNEWCGPFSVARQLIEARAEAREEAKKAELEKEKEGTTQHHPLDAMIHEMEQENLAKVHPSMKWKSRLNNNNDFHKEEGAAIMTQLPANANYYARRKKRKLVQEEKQIRLHGRVPSLFDLCVRFLVDNIDYVESLGFMVDDSIRRAICETLVARSGASKLNGAVLDTITDVGMEVLELIDCTQITKDHMAELLSQLVPAGLKAILFQHCGRCFGNNTVQAIVESSPSISLFAISLSGAYLLKDADAAKMIQSCSQTLSSIQLSACPLLGTFFCSSIAQFFSSSSLGTLLELSLEDIPLSKEHLLQLVELKDTTSTGTTDCLRNLKSLSLKQIDSLDDDVLSKLLEATAIAGGQHLESLCLYNLTHLTDQSLESIRRCCCQNLKVLHLEGLRFITNIGLETFFTPNLPGLSNPPMLKKLELSKLSKNVVDDKVLELAMEASIIRRDLVNYSSNNDSTSNNAISQEEKNNYTQRKKFAFSTIGGLVDIKINQSNVTDRTLEKIAFTCASTLMELDVSFCCDISNKGLGYLVDNVGDQLRKISVWGCAQITDEFVDGHSRVGEIEVEGAWMKKTELSFCSIDHEAANIIL